VERPQKELGAWSLWLERLVWVTQEAPEAWLQQEAPLVERYSSLNLSEGPEGRDFSESREEELRGEKLGVVELACSQENRQNSSKQELALVDSL
jgi:hypothetical protein